MYIEVKDNKLKCLKVKKRGRKYKLLEYQEIDIDFDSSTLQKIIKEISKARRMSDSKVHILFNNKQLFYREVRLPMLSKKKLKSIFNQEMVHALPGVQDVVADYIVLDQDQEKKEYRVLGSAMETKTIVDSMAVIKQAGLGKVKSINSYNNAIINYVKNADEIKDKCYIVADISTSQIKLFLFENNRFVIVRSSRDLNVISDFAIKEEISKMMQFQSSRSKTIKVNNVYYFTSSKVVEEIVNGFESSDVYSIKPLPLLKDIETEKINANSCVGLIGMIVGGQG